jgi:hypothetical protein
MIRYDNRFDANEWFFVVALLVGIIVVISLPKRFSRKVSILFFMCGVFSGFFFDHSLSVEPVSYYDVNDASAFEIMDFVSYWTFGGYSYLFFYIYDCLGMKSSHFPLYVLIWSLISVGFERLGVAIGAYHYQHGYTILYSFPIYLIVHTCWIALYYRYWGPSRTASA